MSQHDVFHRFAEAFLSGGADIAGLSRCRAVGPIHYASRGEVVELAVPPGRHFIFLMEGAVKLVGHVGLDREQIVAFAFKGDLLAGPPPSRTPYTLHALAECRLLALPVSELVRLLAADVRAAGMIVERALLALDYSREGSVLLGRKTAAERIASFLVSMAERIGRPQSKVVAIDLPMSRREIADSLGLTIETVSRQLTDLRDKGLISTPGRWTVIVHDLKRLGEIGAQAPAELDSFDVLI